MRYSLLIIVAALGACSSAGAKEEEKYQMVIRKTEGQYKPYVARCAQAKAVAAAYLSDQNEAKYREWADQADLDCGLQNVEY